jgi:nitrite reductase (NO-forming)
MVATLLLGFTVAIVGVFALMMWADAHKARDAAAQPAPAQNHAVDHNVALPLSSFAGVVPENAAELAAAHKPYDATLPPLRRRPRQGAHDAQGHHRRDRAGRQVQHVGLRRPRRPRPDRARREGQTVEMTLTNGGAIPALDRLPRGPHRTQQGLPGCRAGRVLHVPLQGRRSGVFMYHCGTKPVLAHIANGCTARSSSAEGRSAGRGQRVRARRERVVPERRRIKEPASLDMAKARSMSPDWTTFNGYANQYVTHPLTANPGETTRFYVVAAGPDAGLPLPRRRHDPRPAWVNADMTSPPQVGVQTVIRARRLVVASSTSRSTTRVSIRSSATPLATSISARSACSRSGNPKGTMSH